jgi:hypothetical protein
MIKPRVESDPTRVVPSRREFFFRQVHDGEVVHVALAALAAVCMLHYAAAYRMHGSRYVPRWTQDTPENHVWIELAAGGCRLPQKRASRRIWPGSVCQTRAVDPRVGESGSSLTLCATKGSSTTNSSQGGWIPAAWEE